MIPRWGAHWVPGRRRLSLRRLPTSTARCETSLKDSDVAKPPAKGSRIHIRDADLRKRCQKRKRSASKGWSVYGAQQAQPAASTGKSAGRRNR